MSLISLLAYPSSNATLSEFIILYKLTGRVILPIHPLFKKCLDSSCLFMFESTCHITHPLTHTHTHSHSHTYAYTWVNTHKGVQPYTPTHTHTYTQSKQVTKKDKNQQRQKSNWHFDCKSTWD